MKILIVDDHELIRKGLRQILQEEYPNASIDEVSDAESAINKTIKESWDLILCDITMPGRSGLDVLDHVRENFPKIPVLILSINLEEEYAIRVLKAGAAGYLSKNLANEELINAVNKVLQGRKYISLSLAERLAEELYNDKSIEPHKQLSDREYDVFKLIAHGKTISEISKQFSLSVTTISTYRSRILAKLNLTTNADLTRYAVKNNLI